MATSTPLGDTRAFVERCVHGPWSTNDREKLGWSVKVMDHREHARVAAIISRRRKQLSSLEEQVVSVRQKLEDDERELARLKDVSLNRPQQASAKLECDAAAKALRKCRKAKGEGRASDQVCSDAGRSLKRCASAKKAR